MVQVSFFVNISSIYQCTTGEEATMVMERHGQHVFSLLVTGFEDGLSDSCSDLSFLVKRVFYLLR
jgi:hypothetical protein